MRLDGFLLGLSNGVSCMTYCAPFLIPYLLSENGKIIRNYLLTGQFLAGRFLGYILYAVLSRIVGGFLPQVSNRQNIVVGVAYIVLSIFLIFYGFSGTFKSYSKRCLHNVLQSLLLSCPSLFPVYAGFATGLNLCPPLLLAFSVAAAETGLLPSVIYFFYFFAGTSVFFVLMPFIGMLKGFTDMKIVGRMAAGVMGIYYLYSGSILFIGGIEDL